MRGGREVRASERVNALTKDYEEQQRGRSGHRVDDRRAKVQRGSASSSSSISSSGGGGGRPSADPMDHFQTTLDPRKQELLEARFLGARVSLQEILPFSFPSTVCPTKSSLNVHEKERALAAALAAESNCGE